AAAAVLLVTQEVLRTSQAGADREPANLFRDPLGGPDALGDLGTAVGGHQHLVTDLRLHPTRVQVVETTVPLEAHRHHHAHRCSLSRSRYCWPAANALAAVSPGSGRSLAPRPQATERR